MALITTNNAKATNINEIISEIKFPYLIAVPGMTNWLRSANLAAFKAGVKTAGVIISSTSEETIFPRAARQ